MNHILFFLILVSIGITSCTQQVYLEKAERIEPISPVFESFPSIAKPFKPPQPFREKPLIVLDAGHGDEDFGTHSLGTPQYYEKNLNLSTAQLVRSFLQQSGYQVMMTRCDDTFIALDQRALFANNLQSKIFVSIHYNSAPSKEAEGIEVYFYDNEENKNRSKESKILAQAILEKTLLNTHAKSRGVKHGNYAVLRETQMPAVLIEGGFLTNAREMEKIKDGQYLKSLALGIAQGIQAYLTP